MASADAEALGMAILILYNISDERTPNIYDGRLSSSFYRLHAPSFHSITIIISLHSTELAGRRIGYAWFLGIAPPMPAQGVDIVTAALAYGLAYLFFTDAASRCFRARFQAT